MTYCQPLQPLHWDPMIKDNPYGNPKQASDFITIAYVKIWLTFKVMVYGYD